MTLPTTQPSATLHLIIPGLLPAEVLGDSGHSVALPELEKLLSRTEERRVMAAGLSSALFASATLASDPACDLPVAPLRRSADGGLPEAGWWLCADPVHLRVERDSVVLFPAEQLAVSAAEAEALVAAFNDFFSERGWRLSAPHPERWYLQLAEDPAIRTYDLDEVVGRNIFPYLPSGRQGRSWHALLNEMQMVLHNCGVNRQREQRGAPLINALWLWGGGADSALSLPWKNIHSDVLIAQGMAQRAGLLCPPPPSSAQQWWQEITPAGESVVVLSSLHSALQSGDSATWWTELQRLEADWFAPLRQWVKKGALQQLNIYPCEGSRFVTYPHEQRRFWRRRRTLATYAHPGGRALGE